MKGTEASSFVVFKDFIYSSEKQRHRQKEKQASCRDPDMGFDPGTPRSHSGPKAGAKPLSHPGIQETSFLYTKL